MIQLLEVLGERIFPGESSSAICFHIFLWFAGIWVPVCLGRGVLKCRHGNFPTLEYLSGRQLWHTMTLIPLSGILQFQKAHNVSVLFLRCAGSLDPVMLPEIDVISFHSNSHLDRSHQVVWQPFPPVCSLLC